MKQQISITTQTELNALYMKAWGDQYVSKAHYDRSAEMMFYTHEAELNPSRFAEFAAQAEKYETNFINGFAK